MTDMESICAAVTTVIVAGIFGFVLLHTGGAMSAQGGPFRFDIDVPTKGRVVRSTANTAELNHRLRRNS